MLVIFFYQARLSWLCTLTGSSNAEIYTRLIIVSLDTSDPTLSLIQVTVLLGLEIRPL
jgi:hypothetical protein